MGLDGSSISSGAYPGFSSGGTINAEHLILTSAKYFQSAVVPGGRNSNPPPSAIPARYTQAKDGAIIIILILFSRLFASGQETAFSKEIKSLFFNIPINIDTLSIVDTLKKNSFLHYEGAERKSYLSTNGSLTYKEVIVSKHLFSFVVSPVGQLIIDTGYIKISLFNDKQPFSTSWRIQFSDKISAEKYFEYIKDTFQKISRTQILDSNKDIIKMASYSISSESEREICEATFFLQRNVQKKKYEIVLYWGIHNPIKD